MANMSFAIAFVSSLGWALTRLASAFNSSLAMQKRLSFLLITSVCGLVILDRPLIAWLPFASSYAFVDLFGNGPGSGSSNPGLELALWINPNFAEAYNRRGWMKRYAGVPGAVNDFSKVISLHPNRSMEESALRIRAEYYANAGKLDDAIDDLERAIQLGQRDSSLDYGDLADYYARAKLYEKALAAYDEVIRKDSQNAEMYDRRAQIYEQLGREEQALKDYSLASALRPTDPTYYHKVVALYKKLAKSKKALEDFKRMLKENSGLGHLF